MCISVYTIFGKMESEVKIFQLFMVIIAMCIPVFKIFGKMESDVKIFNFLW